MSEGKAVRRGGAAGRANDAVGGAREAAVRPDQQPEPTPAPATGPGPQPTPEPAEPTDIISRRGALKVIAAGAALSAVAPSCAPGEGGSGGSGGSAGTDAAHTELSGFNPLPPSNPLAAGTATDPDMLAPVVPWEMVLTDEELRYVADLADVIIPADDRSPAASAVGVPDYINEFVSAPTNTEQLTQLRGGLAWLNRAARERFGAADFPALTIARKREICDEIRFEPDAPEELKPRARFFDAFRDMCSTGFWTTEEGMRDLGYMGNVPLPSFDGPPAEVLERLGLAGEDLV